jgi:hypothetical protein
MRVSTAALALACLVIGYAFVGTRVNAREDVSPTRRFPASISVGSRVRLWFPGDSDRVVYCTIARIDDGWILCATPEDPFNKPPDDVWYDLAHVASVTKLDTRR